MTVHVAAGGHDVHGHERNEQTGHADMQRLEVAVPRPQPPPQRAGRRRGQEQQQQQAESSGRLVGRRGQLHVFDHRAVDDEQQQHVQNCGEQNQPAHELVDAQGEWI